MAVRHENGAGMTAIVKVKAAILDMTATALPDHERCANLNPNEPLSLDGKNAVVVQVGNVEVESFEYNAQTLYSTVVSFECYDHEANDDRIAAAHSAIVAAVHADPTLGGRLQDFVPTSFEAARESGLDVGGSIIAFELKYFTPRGDMTMIVGAGGQLF
jgi:hypothetical protein